MIVRNGSKFTVFLLQQIIFILLRSNKTDTFTYDYSIRVIVESLRYAIEQCPEQLFHE